MLVTKKSLPISFSVAIMPELRNGHRNDESYIPIHPCSQLTLHLQVRKSSNLFRDRLDYFLLGTMSAKTRAKLVEQLFDTDNDDAFMKLELWAFLDSSVLNSSFKKLNALVFHPERWNIDKLFNIISNHSPLIEKLNLNLEDLTYGPEMQNIFVTSLPRFKHLTCLSIEYIDDGWTPFLSSLGSCCSKLTKLSLKSNCSFKTEHLLALIAGEQAGTHSEYYSKEAEEPNIHKLKIPEEHFLLSATPSLN